MLLVFVFLVVLQGTLGDDLGIIFQGSFHVILAIFVLLGKFCSLGPGWTLVHVLLSVVSMSNIVHAFGLSSTGVDVRVASARFHSFGEADAGLRFPPTAWTI